VCIRRVSEFANFPTGENPLLIQSVWPHAVNPQY
jgi:hypothetical protein